MKMQSHRPTDGNARHHHGELYVSSSGVRFCIVLEQRRDQPPLWEGITFPEDAPNDPCISGYGATPSEAIAAARRHIEGGFCG